MLSKKSTTTSTSTSTKRPPPVPLFVIRNHESAITTIKFTCKSKILISGDESGTVLMTLMKTMRTIKKFKAHDLSILSIELIDSFNIITHGRDNLVKVWYCPDWIDESIQIPIKKLEFHVNALNFCNISYESSLSLLAAPHLADSSSVDIWKIPSIERVHRSIGNSNNNDSGRGPSKTGICMTLKVVNYMDHLHLLIAFEDGSLALFKFINNSWELMWRIRKHKDSIMSMCVSRDFRNAYTISVDKYVIKYYLQDMENDEPKHQVYTLLSNGHSSVNVRYDNRILAIGCWNGDVELYSTKSMKLLGILSFHKNSVTSIDFSNIDECNQNIEDEDDDQDNNVIEGPSHTLLATSGNDDRIAIYQINL